MRSSKLCLKRPKNRNSKNLSSSLSPNEVNNDDTEDTLYSLYLENRNLRNFLKLHKKYDMSAEELMLKAKENYIRSKSLQVKPRPPAFSGAFGIRESKKETGKGRDL